MRNLYQRGKHALQKYGLLGTLIYSVNRLCERLKSRYQVNSPSRPRMDELETQRKERFSNPCKISVAVAVYNTDPPYLHELATSLQQQTYSNWEACLYDGGSTDPQTRLFLEELSTNGDDRFHVQNGITNDGIALNGNHAIQMCTGEYVAFCDHDDVLTENALYEVAKAIRETDADILYSDEDKIYMMKSDSFYEPHLKPDYAPDTLRSSNYICHLTVIRRSLLTRLGGYKAGYDGSQDYDLILRATELSDKIVHISKVLYHWRMHPSSMSHTKSEQCVENARKALEDHLHRLGEHAFVKAQSPYLHTSYAIETPKTLSLILWNDEWKETPTDVIEGYVKSTAYRPLEVLTLGREDKRQTIASVQVFTVCPQSNGYAALNQIARSATGDILCFIHSQVRPTGEKWAEELVSMAQRGSVGVAGSMVYSRNQTVIHAGYAIGRDHIASGIEAGQYEGIPGRFMQRKIIHNVAAISCAYCAIRAKLFQEMNGFDEEYSTQLSDVDLCQRLLGAGLYNVYTPYAPAQWVGRRSKTVFLLNKAPNAMDARVYMKKWPAPVRDPYYNEQFRSCDANYSIS